MRIVDNNLDIDGSGNMKVYEYGSIDYIKQVINCFLYVYRNSVVYSNNYSDFIEVIFNATKEADVIDYVNSFIDRVSEYIGNVIKDFNVNLDKRNKKVRIEFFIAGGEVIEIEYSK